MATPHTEPTRCDTHVHDKNHAQVISYLQSNAKILHTIFPVLKCYEEFYIEYCQLVTDVAYISITINVTISLSHSCKVNYLKCVRKHRQRIINKKECHQILN